MQTDAYTQPAARSRAPHSPAAHFGGEGRGRVLQRPVEEVSPQHPLPRESTPAPHHPCHQAAQTLLTWWRGWRQRRRLTGGGGQLPRPRPCPRRCESAARSPPSATASSLPGPSGSQSGPGGSLSGSWGAGQETQGLTAWTAYTCDPDSGALYPQPTGPELPSDHCCCSKSPSRGQGTSGTNRPDLCCVQLPRPELPRQLWALEVRIPGRVVASVPCLWLWSRSAPTSDSAGGRALPLWDFLPGGQMLPFHTQASLLTGRPGTRSTRCWPLALAVAQGFPSLSCARFPASASPPGGGPARGAGGGERGVGF